jgi:hypothetical protein
MPDAMPRAFDSAGHIASGAPDLCHTDGDLH